MVRQFRDTDWETAFSGVPGLVVVRILLCISTILESSAVPGDFSVAFMSTPLHDAEFIEPPIEAESDSRYVWKLRKALNGLKKASQLFSNYLSDILVDKLGFEKCSLVPTAFYHRETDLRTAIHVDDPLTIGEIDTVMRFYDSLKQWLLVRVQDVVGSMKSSIYLGVQVLAMGTLLCGSSNRTLLRGCICTRWYDQLQICCDTWSQASRTSSRFPGGEATQLRGTFNLPSRRRKVAIHCGTKARFVVPLKEAGRQLANPREFDMIGLKRIMRYISGTENDKLFLEMSKEERVAARTGQRTTVTATCDTDWAGCAETRRSTTCVCIDWGGFLITCFSRSQTALGLLSPEAEYYGICSAGSELIYVMGVIRFFGFEVDGWILSDSSGALSLSQRQGVGHQRHIEARYLWIQDHVQRGTFKVGKIPGSLNKADVVTKHVAREDLQRHTRALGLREWQAPDENPRDVRTITNRLSMMWPRIFYRKKHA